MNQGGIVPSLKYMHFAVSRLLYDFYNADALRRGASRKMPQITHRIREVRLAADKASFRERR